LLVYSMTYRAGLDLAMVLPLPVPPDPPEDAVSFINLEKYPGFFADMGRGFGTRDAWLEASAKVSVAAATLKVHDVGAFEASFVPQIEALARLDERFRIPAAVWDEILDYGDYGFAVFKLKSTGASAAAVHPMAFEFPQRDPERLFFPTVHIHDRAVHRHAPFDHTLYCQLAPDEYRHIAGWQGSRTVASAFVDTKGAKGVVDGDQHCWRRTLRGWLTNQDTWVGEGGSVPQARA
jgi:hypothetical protein